MWINISSNVMTYIAKDLVSWITLDYGLGLTCPDALNDKVNAFYLHIAEGAERVILWLIQEK